MIEFHGFEVIQPNKIDEYMFSGVWAMFGIEKTDKKRKYRCLNVGKNRCIGDELKVDFERLNNFKLVRKKVYRNQFNEKMFSYKEYATRQDWLYKEISEKYEEIVFILVANQSEYTYTIEKYFAYSTKAAYWVSNGKYSSERMIDNSRIEEIRNDIDVSRIDKSLILKINKLKDCLDEQNCFV